MVDRTISVIINTNGRCASLVKTLEALRWQRYPSFEVIVVCGPTRDGTHEVAAERVKSKELKAANCSVANLSASRNIGIAQSSGDIVAFIDDDALPEPVWLEQLVPSFDHPNVAGVSGLVFSPNGRDVQFRYSTCDRFGNARHGLLEAGDEGAYPLSAHFPHAMGTNALFRRSALVDVCGFDEEYEYYLDEADLCCRLIDAGYLLRQRPEGPVHHKFLTGTVRDGEGITVKRYPVLKNQLYFSLVNGRGHFGMSRILEEAQAFAARHRAELEDHVAHGRLHEHVLTTFAADWERALETGLRHGLEAKRRLPSRENLSTRSPFQRYPTAAGGSSSGRHIGLKLHRHPGRAAPHRLRGIVENRTGSGDFVRILVPQQEGQASVGGADVEGGVWVHCAVSNLDDALKNPSCGQSGCGQEHPSLTDTTERIADYYPFDVLDELEVMPA